MNCIIHTSAFVLNRKTQQTNIVLFFGLLWKRDLLNLTEIDAAGRKAPRAADGACLGLM